jgi:hypothetical protein
MGVWAYFAVQAVLAGSAVLWLLVRALEAREHARKS